MAYSIHVNGAALIRVGNQGAGVDTPSDVGFSDAGVDIVIDYNKEPVMADNAGTAIPADLQKMGKSAKITMNLVVYDDTVFRARFVTDGAVEGEQDPTGTLIFANDDGFRVIITSPIDGIHWRFLYCSVDYCRARLGSKYNIWSVGIDAIPYVANGTSLSGKKLFDHTNG